MSDAANPLVSVVIPACNSEAFIERALTSVIAQDYRPVEVVVVDDGSEDRTAAVAAAFDPLVRCVSQPNRGVSAARNRGVEAAAGPLVAFLDSDDEWLPGRLSTTVRPLVADPGLGLCYCRTERVELDGERLIESDPARDRLTPWGIYPPPFIHPSAATVRRDAFHACGGFDEAITNYEDFELFVRLAETAGVSQVEEVLVLHHVRAGSLAEAMTIDTDVDMLLRFLLGAVARRETGRARDDALADAMVRAGERRFRLYHRSAARRYYGAAFALHPSWRCGRLVVKTLLPRPVLALVRWLRGRRAAGG